MTWERITGPMTFNNLWRAKVPGGWLVCAQGDDMGSGATGITFVPDAEHAWRG